VAPIPAGVRFQPVEADEVAARLVERALAEPAGIGARHGWAAGVRRGGAAPRLPSGH
jgi:hypothetical protein